MARVPAQVLGLPTQVESRSYDDVYGSGFGWAAGVGYRLGETGEFRIQGSYTSNPAERLQVGSVAGLPLFALFDDYKAFGMDFGYRQYFGSGKARPFIGASGGFVRLEEIKSEFSVPAAGVVLSEVDFYGSSVVPSFGCRRRHADFPVRHGRAAGRHRVQVAGRCRRQRWPRRHRPRVNQ